jgi:HK97 family phage major capsid protein/HK97 family phage prohead protease
MATQLTELRQIAPLWTGELPQTTDDNSFEFSFSSPNPYERFYGVEILDHKPESVRLDRLNDGAPILFNHDPNQLVGVAERAWIENGKGYVYGRYSSSQFAQQVRKDVADGIIRNVSVGYKVYNQVDQRDGSYLVTDWEPFEVSFVAIPADPTVGVQRTLEIVENMPESNIDLDSLREQARNEERGRVKAIREIGRTTNQPELAVKLEESGCSLEEAKTQFLKAIQANQPAPVGNVDLSPKEQRSYSVVRAINAVLKNDWSEAGLEREVNLELSRQAGRQTQGFFIPGNLQTRATYAVGANDTGGRLVATDLLASSFIDVLRNAAVVMSLGPTMIAGLVGNVSIPRQATATATYWVTENTALTQAEATFDNVTLSPKQIGTRSQYSRLMLQQATPDIESVVRNDLIQQLALGIDLAAISGTGLSGQPTGILNAAGVGNFELGANANTGAALANSSATAKSGLDPLIEIESLVNVANALNGSLYYLTNSKVILALKKLKSSASFEYLWTGDKDSTLAGTPILANGYPVARSNQVPSNLVKGTSAAIHSALIFGNFADLIIGMWGALEIVPNPYGSGYNSGAVDIRAMQTIDIALRHAVSFAVIKDIVA